MRAANEPAPTSARDPRRPTGISHRRTQGTYLGGSAISAQPRPSAGSFCPRAEEAPASAGDSLGRDAGTILPGNRRRPSGVSLDKARASMPVLRFPRVPPRLSIRSDFESAALAELDALYRAALRLTRSAAEADDLVQDTFVKAFRARGPLRAGHEPARVAVHDPDEHVAESPPRRRARSGRCGQRTRGACRRARRTTRRARKSCCCGPRWTSI